MILKRDGKKMKVATFLAAAIFLPYPWLGLRFKVFVFCSTIWIRFYYAMPLFLFLMLCLQRLTIPLKARCFYSSSKKSFSSMLHSSMIHFSDENQNNIIEDTATYSSSTSMTCPDGLKTYISKRIFEALAGWGLEDTNRRHTSEEITANLILQTHNGLTTTSTNLKAKEFRKSILEQGMCISHILSTSKIQDLDLLKDNNLKKVMDHYFEDRDKNLEMFQHITNHHNALADSIEDWVRDEAIVKQSNLDSYASAAADMGEKDWVKHGNMWMQHHILDQFRLGRSKKDFMKRIKAMHHYKDSEPRLTLDQIENLASTLPDDLFGTLSSQSVSRTPASSSQTYTPSAELLNALESSKTKSIKVVDVGSCYNPFVSGPYRNLLEVTALDLRPTRPSVHECDFLRLRFGPSASSPVFADASVSTDSSSSSASESSRTLLQLPEHSFDAVTMSLVLCYLPTPAARLAMIRQARRLLVHTDYDEATLRVDYFGETKVQRLHHRGLLVIFEKQSILPVSKNVDLFMSHWKEVICNEGFEFVRHERVVHDRHQSHGFVFRTAQLPATTNTGSIILDSMKNNNIATQKSTANVQESFITTSTLTTDLGASLEVSTLHPATDTVTVPVLKKDGLYIKHDFWRKRNVDADPESYVVSTGPKRQAL